MTEAELFLREQGFDPASMRGHDMGHRSIGDFANFHDWIIKKMMAREEYIKKFGFAILSTAAIEAMRPYAPLVEVGCGSGYWAYELRKASIDVVATEPYPGVKGQYRGADWKMWTEHEMLTGTQAVRKYPSRTLLTVWPDYNKRWATKTLSMFKGDVVIYVGEWRGCTAEDSFHDMLEEKFKIEKEINIPQFDGIHDYMHIYRRNP